MRKSLSLLFSVLTLVVLLSSVNVATVRADAFDVQKAIAAGDHKGLADYYKAQAEAQRKIADMHSKMQTSYRESHVHYKGSENALATHCGNLKFQALKLAEQYDELAKQEEKLSEKK